MLTKHFAGTGLERQINKSCFLEVCHHITEPSISTFDNLNRAAEKSYRAGIDKKDQWKADTL